MGRIRVKSKKSSATSKDETSQPSVESLFSKAQTLLTQCDYDLAQKFALRILERSPASVEAKEMLGITQLEMGQLSQARKVRLERSAANS